MSRSGYIPDYDFDDNLTYGRYRGAVLSAIRGRRGQTFLRDMLVAMDAMPEKRLIAGALVDEDGEQCALGCLALARGLDVTTLDPEEPGQIAAAFDINEKLAREIAFENDEAWGPREAPEERWKHMRAWIERHIESDVGIGDPGHTGE